MKDYRLHMCLLDGTYLARCVAQNFYTEELTFEVEKDGERFTRPSDSGVEIYDKGDTEDGTPTFDEVKHRLRRIDEEGSGTEDELGR
jgi:hypothetical protein